MHYSQLPAAIVEDREGPDAPLQLRAQGFLTAEITAACMHRLHERACFAAPGARPERLLLIDLRDAVGYESAVTGMVASWLSAVHLSGLRRIAMVANSSVLRTALDTLSGGPTLVRCFSSPAAALGWLSEEPSEPITITMPSRSHARHLQLDV